VTPDTAEGLVDKLMAAFPRFDWTDETIDLYARCLEPVYVELGDHAVHRAITTLDSVPTVRWLLDTARAEGRRIGREHTDPQDGDEAFNADPAVAQRVRGLYVEACARIDQRATRVGKGDSAHWHGGPDPCPVCGGQVPSWLKGSK
jgi:hypothetical protein